MRFSVPIMLLGLTSAASAQTFTGLGLLPGGTESQAAGVSTDGSVVTGRCYTSANGTRAIRWTAGTGMVDIGALPGANGTAAYGVSGNGLVIVGSSYASGDSAFSWNGSIAP